MFEHNILMFIFHSKTMIVKDEDDYDGVFSLDSLLSQMNALINFFIFGTSQKGTLFGALYDGIRFVN